MIEIRRFARCGTGIGTIIYFICIRISIFIIIIKIIFAGTAYKILRFKYSNGMVAISSNPNCARIDITIPLGNNVKRLSSKAGSKRLVLIKSIVTSPGI